MFTRKLEQSGPDVGRQEITKPIVGSPQVPKVRVGARRSEAATATVIGSGLTVKGNIESKGEVQVEGEIQGDVHAASIVVGEQARITGKLVASNIIIRGQVSGLIRGNNVMMQSSSRVEGDIFHKLLTVEQGAFFEGRARRSEDPMMAQVTGGGMQAQPSPGK